MKTVYIQGLKFSVATTDFRHLQSIEAIYEIGVDLSRKKKDRDDFLFIFCLVCGLRSKEKKKEEENGAAPNQILLFTN